MCQCLIYNFIQDDSRLSSLLNRNYYTIAHDLNPSDEKHEKQGTTDDSAIAYTADEPSFLNTVMILSF